MLFHILTYTHRIGEKRGRVEREREKDCSSFKELAQVIVEAGKCKICRAGQKPGDKRMSCSWSPETTGW